MGAKSRARGKRQILNETSKAKRVARSWKLLQISKKSKPVIFLTDEKLFCIDRASNSRPDRYISNQRPEDVPEHIRFTFKTKHPAFVMVFGLVASDGKKMPPVFIE